MDSVEFAGRQGRQPNRCYRTGMRTRSRSSLDAVKTSTTFDIGHTAFPSDLGWMALAWKGPLLVELTFGHGTAEQATTALHAAAPGSRAVVPGNHPAARSPLSDVTQAIDRLIRSWIDRLQAYVAGDCHDDLLDIAVDVSHLTAFQRAVVHHCRRIPRGEVVTYGELARRAGYPGAARAVGQVMATNRIPLVIPCHRVVAAGGRLGGYSAPQGLAMKKRLLAQKASQPSLPARITTKGTKNLTAKLDTSRNDRPRYRLVRLTFSRDGPGKNQISRQSSDNSRSAAWRFVFHLTVSSRLVSPLPRGAEGSQFRLPRIVKSQLAPRFGPRLLRLLRGRPCLRRRAGSSGPIGRHSHWPGGGLGILGR